MSSVLGVRLEDCIFIGTDTQETEYEGNMPIRKKTKSKIWCTSDWALAYVGAASSYLEDFRALLEGHKSAEEGWNPEKAKEMIKKSFNGNEPIFREVGELNRQMRRNGYKIEDTNEFLFAAINPFKMWYIDECGNVLDYNGLCKRDDKTPAHLEHILLGSGEDRMREYIKFHIDDEDGILHASKINIRTAPLAIAKILNHAQEDIATNGPISIIAVTKKGIYDYSKRFKKSAREAEIGEAEDIGMELEELLEEG